MPLLTGSLASSMRSSVAARSTVLTRSIIVPLSFRTSSVRASSGSDHTDGHEDRQGKIEHHKQDQLRKQEGKARWAEELATNSEAAIKADRDEIEATQDDIDQLQKETEEQLKQKIKGN